MKGELSIVRPGAKETEEIRLILKLDVGKTITLTMTPEDFALAITGKSELPVDVRLRNLRIEDK
ncbi:hypothetical protein [Pectobacterium brasiliense]|uniref:hypothetical protein n=1 Tax=Pectobacterium brasiliense TaxID=180957 RepID=UPI0025A3114C|nr:hypothetical protein [Pectobacterium brasiliense]WJM80545.1 hypothetical protein QTI90_20130 [Pectobacterium brasiliense]